MKSLYLTAYLSHRGKARCRRRGHRGRTDHRFAQLCLRLGLRLGLGLGLGLGLLYFDELVKGLWVGAVAYGKEG